MTTEGGAPGSTPPTVEIDGILEGGILDDRILLDRVVPDANTSRN